MSKYRVMIVEDQEIPRKFLEFLIASSEDYEVVASIDNAATADIFCLTNNIDLILMDVITKNGNNGLVAAEKIKNKFPEIKIIVATSMPEFSYIERAKSIGVESFWYKDNSNDSILHVMDETMKGNCIYPDETPVVTLGNALSTDFSEKELEILKQMTGGYTNTEISQILFMSTSTIKSHIQSMLDKTGFRNRTELAVKARESGIVILDEGAK